MKITLRECLSLEEFKNAKLLSGERCMDYPLKAVSVLDVKDKRRIREHVSGRNTLLLSGFFTEDWTIAEQKEIIDILVADKVCGLVLMPFEAANVPTVEIIDYADGAGIPLILLPKNKETNYAGIIEKVMSLIIRGDDFENRLIINTIFHLLNFEKHRTFEEAVKQAAIQNQFQFVLLSEDYNPILMVETRKKTSLEEVVAQARDRQFDRGAVYTRIDVKGILTYWGPVTVNGDKYYMLIVDNEDMYSAAEITKLAEIIQMAMGMWKYTPQKDAKAEFIKALKRGNRSLAYSLKDEINIDGDSILSVFFAKGIENEAAYRIFLDFEKTNELGILKIIEENETFGVLFSKEDGEEETLSIKRGRCIELFNQLKSDKKVRIFHVTGLDGIEGAAEAYRLIGESYGFVQKVFPYKRVFTKYELALISNCIALQTQGGYGKKNYLELLDPFKEGNENKGRQLLETLETFVLDAGMNSAKTSEFMGIHTNTVQYRLKKINEMLDVEITGNRVIPGLTIALALKRLERGDR